MHPGCEFKEQSLLYGRFRAASNYTGGRAQGASSQTFIINIQGTIAAGSKREVSEAVAGAVDQARRVGTSRSEQSLTVRFE